MKPLFTLILLLLTQLGICQVSDTIHYKDGYYSIYENDFSVFNDKNQLVGNYDSVAEMEIYHALCGFKDNVYYKIDTWGTQIDTISFSGKIIKNKLIYNGDFITEKLTTTDFIYTIDLWDFKVLDKSQIVDNEKWISAIMVNHNLKDITYFYYENGDFLYKEEKIALSEKVNLNFEKIAPPHKNKISEQLNFEDIDGSSGNLFTITNLTTDTIPYIFFSTNYVQIIYPKKDKFGIIDYKGQVVVPFEYDWAFTDVASGMVFLGKGAVKMNYDLGEISEILINSKSELFVYNNKTKQVEPLFNPL